MQIQAAGVDQVAVACSFCMNLLDGARGALGAEELEIRTMQCSPRSEIGPAESRKAHPLTFR